MRKLIVIGAVALLAIGCMGTRFNFEQVRQVKAGMTQAEVQAVMGKPNVVQSAGSKTEWGYFWTGLTSLRVAKFTFENGKLAEAPVVPDGFR